MQEWWNSPTAAWGFLIIGIGGGTVLAYLLPTAGIPVCSLLIVIGILLIIRAYRRRDKSKKTVEVKTEIVDKSENLTDTLTAMHRRLVELQKEKASHTKVGIGQLERVIPTLVDRLGAVKIKDWFRFEKKVKQRVQRAIPKPHIRRRFSFREFAKFKERVHLAALSVAQQVKDELFQSKQWTFEDGMKVAEWLDGYNWGVKSLRDNDLQWNTLYRAISYYLRDDTLRQLIGTHIDLSYIYNNVSLITYYSEKYPRNVFSSMLHETLVGSPISPVKIDLALSEILEKIDGRMKALKRRGKQSEQPQM